MRRILTLLALGFACGCSASVQLNSASSVPSPSPSQSSQSSGAEVAAPPQVVVQNVEFDSARAQIREGSRRQLDELAATLLQDGSIERVDIDGHTDGRGTPDRNLQLSIYRANAVRQHLIERGIAAERLVARGLGDERPISDNVTAEGRQLNRRVEFTIYRGGRSAAGAAVASR
jgi:outer membrane protein OmpA-like peptidoglycan-associated protein